MHERFDHDTTPTARRTTVRRATHVDLGPDRVLVQLGSPVCFEGPCEVGKTCFVIVDSAGPAPRVLAASSSGAVIGEPSADTGWVLDAVLAAV